MNEIYGRKLKELIKKIQDTSGLVTRAVLNTKISEVENKKPDTSSSEYNYFEYKN